MDVLEPYGNSLELAELHPEDLRTITNIKARGIQVVVILVSGRPLVIDRELALSDAFVAAWLPGSEGHGVADVLFGDFDFQGKLAFSWPANDEFSPAMLSENRKALFAPGYGLSYRDTFDTQPLMSRSA
jgi:beta-glucosidase